MKAGLLTLLLAGGTVFLSSSAQAQLLPTWAGRAGNANLPDTGYDVATDARGNVVVVGEISGNADFGGVQLPGQGARPDGFITQYGPNGAVRWARRLVATGRSTTRAVTTDAAGCTYATGSFAGDMTLQGLPMQRSTGNQDIFLLKLSPTGRLLWVRQAGSAAADEAGLDVCVGPGATLTLAGRCGSGSSFGNTASPTVNGTHDLFVARYDSAGTLQWVRTAGGSPAGNLSDADAATAIGADAAGNVYVTGSFNGAATFGSTTVTAGAATAANVFLAKYDAQGAAQWVRTASSALNGGGLGLAVSSDGDCALTGEIRGTVDFGGQPLTFASQWPRAFMARYDAVGTLAWARQLDSFSSRGRSVVLDSNDNCYLTGEFFQRMSVAGQSLQPVNGQFMLSDVYLTRYDAQGNANWVMRGGGGGDDVSYGLAISPQGVCYATGAFQQSADFGNQRLSTSNDDDVFLVRLNGLTSVTATARATQAADLLNVFPNPTDAEFQLRWPAGWAGAGQAWINNSLGQRVWEQAFHSPIDRADVRRLQPGVYLFTAQTAQGRLTQRVVVER